MLSYHSAEYKVTFDTPDLILTQRGAQDKDKNKFLKFTLTPDAINSFIEKNRKFFEETQGDGDWKFDESVTEKTEPFKLENKIKEETKENFKIVDYVRVQHDTDIHCAFVSFKYRNSSYTFLLVLIIG